MGQKNPEAKNGEKYIESKHSCMVNRVKKTERQKNPEGNTLNQNIYAWLMGQKKPPIV